MKELVQPLRMSRPGRSSDEVAIDMGRVDGDVHELAAGSFDLWRNRGISRAAPAFEDAGSRQDLGSMAKGSNGFLLFRKVPHDFQDFFVKAQILRRASARNDEGVIVLGLHLTEGGVEREVMAGFFRCRSGRLRNRE
jgi:hypothetical protein